MAVVTNVRWKGWASWRDRNLLCMNVVGNVGDRSREGSTLLRDIHCDTAPSIVPLHNRTAVARSHTHMRNMQHME
jgi:hypothetical protein